MSGNSDYISQMVQDTFNDLEEGNVLAFSGRSKRSSHEQLEMDFNRRSATFDLRRGCLILEFGGEPLEIPLNWGPFRSHSFEKGVPVRVYIDATNDSYHLLRALSVWGQIETRNLLLEWDGASARVRVNCGQSFSRAA